MCGIVGIVNRSGRPVATGLLRVMTDVMAHRGPDGEGHLAEGPIGLGHRRLAVIDPSPAGHQPMISGSAVITYNGEIYNFRELRSELEKRGYEFRSQTDTEVVLNAYREWGERCLEHFNGMFAFAIWDRQRRRLFIARDRYGIKPLYYYSKGGVLVFASEIKAILKHPEVSRAVSYPALNEYFSFQNIFSDLTLFEGVHLLPPGKSLALQLGDPGASLVIRRYWQSPAPGERLDLTEDECVERLYELFVKAVRRQLVSDVPVGSYLSGGVDSGSITAVAVRHLPRLASFTGGFDLTSAAGLELGFDERPKAECLANLFKTEHYEVVMHAGDMEWVLPRLIWHLEDLRVGQCYPNYYVARLASKFVKVVLSGAGGDELFGGYPWRYGAGLKSAHWEDYFWRYYKYWQRLASDEEKARLFNDETNRKTTGHSTFDVFREVFGDLSGGPDDEDDYVNASFAFELKTFLHGLLVVEDKVSMAHSLETRVPFLDDELADFALRLPVSHKLRKHERSAWMDENVVGKVRLYHQQSNNGKAILRRTMSRLIPNEVTERVKQGFSAPDASWFRGESIDYVNQSLRDPEARIYDHLNREYVSEILDQHCSGKVNRRLLIWSLLSFEWWLRNFIYQDASYN